MLKSRNYAPCPALAPYVARHYVFSVAAPVEFELVDRLLAETPFIRILLRGDWAAELEPGEWRAAGPMVFFGANARPMTVRVRGGFLVIGIAIRSCGWRGLFDGGADEFTDRMLSLNDLWGQDSDALHQAVAGYDEDAEAADARLIMAMEQLLLARLSRRGMPPAEPAMAALEMIARNDSTMLIRDVATRIGLSSRQTERQCHACFGMSPKTVLRRSRFLDMAAAMRGLSQPSEEELAALRYYDQSHLSREFRHFIGLTPGQFATTPTPLLTAGLELRALRKVEDAALQAMTTDQRELA